MPRYEKYDDDRYEVGLEESLKRLKSVTLSLRMLGFYAILCTAFNLIGLLVLVIAQRVDILIIIRPSVYVLFQILICCAAILAVVCFEFRRSHADVLFEEISDELHWGTAQKLRKSEDKYKMKSEEYSNERPRLHARILIRDYAKASELPFFPGRIGPAWCILWNVMLVIAGVIVTSFLTKS